MTFNQRIRKTDRKRPVIWHLAGGLSGISFLVMLLLLLTVLFTWTSDEFTGKTDRHLHRNDFQFNKKSASLGPSKIHSSRRNWVSSGC